MSKLSIEMLNTCRTIKSSIQNRWRLKKNLNAPKYVFFKLLVQMLIRRVQSFVDRTGLTPTMQHDVEVMDVS